MLRLYYLRVQERYGKRQFVLDHGTFVVHAASFFHITHSKLAAPLTKLPSITYMCSLSHDSYLFLSHVLIHLTLYSLVLVRFCYLHTY